MGNDSLNLHGFNLEREDRKKLTSWMCCMTKQGKRSEKRHLSKGAFTKIRYKQDMWRVYKHTGKDKEYEVYKEALHAATNEVRKSKRN